jgi:hypothetical protein
MGGSRHVLPEPMAAFGSRFDPFATVTAVIWYSADFTRTFGAVFFGAITCIGIYPVLRDAKRLADAVGPSEIVSNPSK